MIYYKEKPKLVEAYQFVGGPALSIILDWINEEQAEHGLGHATSDGTSITIPLASGSQTVELTQWIVKLEGSTPVFTILSAHEFNARYEVA